MNTPIVNIDQLSKSYGRQAVLGPLSWQLEPGAVVGLLGRNGAGKSTLLECMLGLRETSGGTVSLFGDPVDALSDAARANIGYVPQQPDLFEWLTPVQMLDFFRALYPRWNTDKVEGLLVRWGFEGAQRHKQIGKLSGGERQRLSIIRALAHDPQLLVLDEPVASLDPVGRRDFLRELVDGVIENNTTVVFSTHILSDLERVALDVAFLHDKQIVLQGKLDDLLDNARRVVGPSAALAGAPLAGELRRSTTGNGTTSIVLRDGAALGTLARDAAIRIEPLSLEDLFVEVTQ